MSDGTFGDSGSMLGRVEPPSFGSTLRRLRERRGVSRERLAFGSGVSVSYITRMERGDRDHPTEQVLTAMVRYLHKVDPVTPVEYRHLLELAALPQHPAAARGPIAADVPGILAAHLPHPAAYLDRYLNVLAANTAHLRTFPGVGEDGNYLRWMLTNPAARAVLPDWESDLRRAIATLRGVMAIVGEAADDARLLTEFGRFEIFRRMWTEEHYSLTGAPTIMRLRDAETGEPYALLWQILRDQSTQMYPDQPLFIVGLPTASRPGDRPVGS
ncbi:helix-turn-helix transcriptional regulator [Nocardia sp. NPDC004860]|uniref:helix-turn-helix transcriptional regulator n=1 Tax=Nocardia sp. NPDC004860 TaxID=3154557 RepID=UPI0033BC4AF7